MSTSGRKSPLVVVASNTAWSIANFRSNLIAALQGYGYRVVALAPPDEHISRIPCELIPVRMSRKGVNPLEDAALFLRLARLFRRLRPFAVLTYTAKMNIYGVAAAHRAGAATVSNISGLGSGFLSGGLTANIMAALYRRACGRAGRVVFQNPDDLEFFLSRRLVNKVKTMLVPGSGVELDRYVPAVTKHSAGFVFLMIARLLRDKGVLEYVEAARAVKAKAPGVEFRLLGALDPGNPSGVPEQELNRWVREGTVDYRGWSHDVRPALGEADCVVLPSYREGTPRTLLEAAAMAKPIITSDVPGCRQVVDDGRTGFLCAVRDSADLAGKMLRMIGLSTEERAAWGLAARAKMEQQFDERIVIRAYVNALSELAG